MSEQAGEATQQPGMLGGLQALAYGAGNPTPLGGLAQMVAQLAPSESQRRSSEWLSFAGGLGAPNTSGGSNLGSGIAAMANDRLERDKLQAQYIPILAQALMQQQAATLSASTASRDYLSKINPAIDTQLAAMRTGDAAPTYTEVVQRIMQVGREYQAPESVLLARIASIPANPAEIPAYLDRLAVAGAGPDKLIPTIGTNAAGQTTMVSPTRGTSQVIGAGGASNTSVKPSANPTSSEVEFEKHTRGDVKSYEEGLRSRVDAYETMLTRMNEQAEYVRNFQPGRYARTASGIAAAVKDIATRLPGFDKTTVEGLTKKLLGSPEGSEEALAAQQLFEQLAQQETIAQLKSTLGEGQRMNQSEYQQFQAVNKGQAMDPATFSGLRSFLFTQAANATNRYSSWNDYVVDPEVARRSVTDFDSRYNKKVMDSLLAGRRDVVSTKPEAARPTYPGFTPAIKPAETRPVEKPAPIGLAAPPAAEGLKAYEPGARAGPTGLVYVLEKGVPRLARKLGATSSAAAPPDNPVNGLRLSDLQPTLNGAGIR
jgi:hypothetical protein